MYFAQPHKCQEIMFQLLQKASKDSNPLIKNKALWYLRLFSECEISQVKIK